MNCKPKIPSFRRSKPKKSRILWRSGRVIKKGKDMRELRKQAFERCEGYCENPQCKTRIFEQTAQLHHVRHKSLGGSDVLENVQMLCKPCHMKAHNQ